MKNGVLLLNKPKGMGSTLAVSKVRKLLNTKQVGHCGTLDPFASGLLIIGFNQATKVMSFLEHEYKEYETIIKLGSSTDTYDNTGVVVSSSEIKPFTKEIYLHIPKYNDQQKGSDWFEFFFKSFFEKVINSFIGTITQTPPIYSSIHVDGRHLYEYARENIEVEIPKRQVTIHEIKLLDFGHDYIKLYVKCSRGTYIRTLGVDIASSLGNDGHLVELRRLSIGNISVNDANSFDDLKEGNIKTISITDAIPFKKLFISDPKILRRVYNGQDIILKNEDEEKIVIVDNNEATAIYEKIDEHKYHCIRGLFNEDIRFKRLEEFYQ